MIDFILMMNTFIHWITFRSDDTLYLVTKSGKSYKIISERTKSYRVENYKNKIITFRKDFNHKLIKGSYNVEKFLDLSNEEKKEYTELYHKHN